MKKSNNSQKISTAVILAAGTGTRLNPLTLNMPKCLTEVNGVPILGRLLDNLKALEFKKVIIVTGYLEDKIRSFVGNEKWKNINFEFVHSERYNSTNNIYSLWLASNRIVESFLLLESDLVFDRSLIEDLLIPNRIAISKYLSFMNGTAVLINSKGIVSKFLMSGRNVIYPAGLNLFKTVNIYSLSLNSWNSLAKELERKIKSGHVNDYYEVVFSDLVNRGELTFKSTKFDSKRWFEIDTIEDLAMAEELFSNQKPTFEMKPLKIAGNRR